MLMGMTCFIVLAVVACLYARFPYFFFAAYNFVRRVGALYDCSSHII